MKILYVTGTKTYAAGNRVLVSWIDSLLRNNDCDLSVVFPPGGTLEIELAKRLDPDSYFFAFHYPFRLNSFLFFIKNFLRILCFVNKKKPDIIHCNGEDIYFVLRYIAKFLKLPVIVHLHFHHSSNFYSWLFKKNFRPSWIFTVSKALYQEELPKLGNIVDLSCVSVLHNCIDVDLIKNLSNKAFMFPNNSTFRLGVVAPIQKRKGQIHALALSSMLMKKNVDFSLYFAGGIRDHAYYIDCQSIIESDASLRERVFFLGFVDKVFSFMKSCHVILSFSSYETFGMTVLEAMALGKAFAGFSVPAIDEVLGQSQLTVPFGDLDSLSDLVLHLLLDPSYRKKIESKLLDRSLMFTPEKIVPKLIQVYQNLVSHY